MTNGRAVVVLTAIIDCVVVICGCAHQMRYSWGNDVQLVRHFLSVDAPKKKKETLFSGPESQDWVNSLVFWGRVSSQRLKSLSVRLHCDSNPSHKLAWWYFVLLKEAVYMELTKNVVFGDIVVNAPAHTLTAHCFPIICVFSFIFVHFLAFQDCLGCLMRSFLLGNLLEM